MLFAAVDVVVFNVDDHDRFAKLMKSHFLLY
jgi:hypothetical protein